MCTLYAKSRLQQHRQRSFCSLSALHTPEHIAPLSLVAQSCLQMKRSRQHQNIKQRPAQVEVWLLGTYSCLEPIQRSSPSEFFAGAGKLSYLDPTLRSHDHRFDSILGAIGNLDIIVVCSCMMHMDQQVHSSLQHIFFCYEVVRSCRMQSVWFTPTLHCRGYLRRTKDTSSFLH